MRNWILYTIVVGFAAYWASNLLLWFPWSYSAVLGMTIMLTVSPVLWTYITYLCLKTYPGNEPLKGAAIASIVLLLISALLDFVFFGLIRGAMKELYHPTTLYGYGFVVSLPFMVAFLMKKRLNRDKTPTTKSQFAKAGIAGSVCLAILTAIIVFGIKI